MAQTYILIDGSYYIFYRLFALVNWWKLSKGNQTTTDTDVDIDDVMKDLHENQEFVDKFIALFHSKILELRNKIKIPKHTDVTYIVGKDCSRKHIWRNNLYSDYKGTRTNYETSTIQPGAFFSLVYANKLFETVPTIKVNMLYNECLEADDCLAIASKEIMAQNPDNKVYIFTSDTDYLQLIQQNVYIYSLKYKLINTPKNSLGCPQQDLLYKIIIGDKSDNIPSVFKRCGPKKTLAYIHDIESLERDLIKYDAHEQYKLNRRLIDFTQIPHVLQEDIKKQVSAFL